MKKKMFLPLLALCAGLASLPLHAATPKDAGKPKDHCEFEHGYGPMGGPGSMGGYGQGMMGGSGSMGGYGAMGGGMMGGFGHGMMGPGMGLVNSLDLSDEQRTKINKLSDGLQHQNWATMGAMMDETAKLRDLYHADPRDPDAIGKEYGKIFSLKTQMIEAMIKTQNDIEALLTPDQKKKLKALKSSMPRPMYGY